jgi:hypothetical protein
MQLYITTPIEKELPQTDGKNLIVETEGGLLKEAAYYSEYTDGRNPKFKILNEHIATGGDVTAWLKPTTDVPVPHSLLVEMLYQCFRKDHLSDAIDKLGEWDMKNYQDELYEYLQSLPGEKLLWICGEVFS